MSLHYAIRNKLLPEVRKLVEGGSDVNDKDDSKRTPLTMCCLEDDEKWALGVGRMLLQAGAKVGITDKNGRSPLTFCVLFKRVDLCGLFLRAIDFDLNQEDILGNTALHYSSLVGNLQICSLILSATLRSNLSINHRNKIGQTPAGLALIKHTNECYQLFKQTPNIEFMSKIPDVILTRPWMREREFVDCPDLMRKDATMDVLEGAKVHRSRPHLNVHQFRRGSAVPRSRKQRCIKRRAQVIDSKKSSTILKTENYDLDEKNGSSWKSVLSEYLEVLREQGTPSYRLAATPVTQSVSEALNYSTPDKTPSPTTEEEDIKDDLNAMNRRKSCMPRIGTNKVRPENYEAFASLPSTDGRRKSRRDSIRNSQLTGTSRRKTIARIPNEQWLNDKTNSISERSDSLSQKGNKARPRRLSKAVSRKSLSVASDSSGIEGLSEQRSRPSVRISLDSISGVEQKSLIKNNPLGRQLDKALSDISETTEDRLFEVMKRQVGEVNG